MNCIIKIIFGLFCLNVLSCTKDANVKLPDQTPIPVVGCFFKPGDTEINLKLTFSQPLYSQQAIPNETNAFVKIESVNDSKVLTYNSVKGNYQVTINPNFFQLGQKYFLYIKLSNGKEITSESIIPNSVIAIKSISSEFANVSAGFTEYKMRVKFDDEPNKVNYFALSYTSLTRNIQTNDTSFSKVQFQQNLTTDNKNDGGEITILTSYYPSDTTNFLGYKIALLNCSKEYFIYSESINKSTNAGGFGTNSFAEPSFVYSNIKNGLGIFAGYTASYKFFKP